MDSYSLDVPLGCLGRLKQASLATCVIPLAHEGQGFVDFIAHLPEVDRIGESPHHQAWLCRYFRQKADRPLLMGSASGLPNDGPIPAGGRCPLAGFRFCPPHPGCPRGQSLRQAALPCCSITDQRLVWLPRLKLAASPRYLGWELIRYGVALEARADERLRRLRLKANAALTPNAGKGAGTGTGASA
jgi:hypothetical protein